MAEQIKIGRNQSNDLVLNYQQVSGEHAILTPIGANSLIIEDVGSSNGTFVNGMQIKKMVISQADRLKVANILINTDNYFIKAVNSNQGQAEINDEEQLSAETEFEKLKVVWETYQVVKLNHKKKGFWKNMGLSVAGLGVGAVITVATGGLGGAMMIGSLLGRGAGGLLKSDEKLQVVENEFKVCYVCPKCKMFLGYNPYEGLVQRKNCMMCKTNWLENK